MIVLVEIKFEEKRRKPFVALYNHAVYANDSIDQYSFYDPIEQTKKGKRKTTTNKSCTQTFLSIEFFIP